MTKTEAKLNTKETSKNMKSRPTAGITLNVSPRTLAGRKVKQLRRQGIVPANVFGSKTKSIAVQVSADVFKKVFAEAGETSLVYLTVGDEKTARPVLIASVQIHPVTDAPLHIDFHQVDLTQKVTADIPVELVGEAPAEKELGATIVQLVNELEVEALPTDLPEKFEIDLSSLKAFGDMISVKDVKVDAAKVEIKNDPELQIVQAQEPQKEEEVVPEAAESAAGGEGEVPAEGESPQATPTEGEAAPAEGEAKSE